MLRYLLLRELEDSVVYEIYNTCTEMTKHMVGMNKGIIWRGKGEEWEFLVAFNEQEVKFNREAQKIPVRIIEVLL